MGDGSFGASRGSRKHNGIDYSVEPGCCVFSHFDGVVTKLGYPYSDDLSYRYIEITHMSGNKHRFFYVEPTVQLGQIVHFGDSIGKAQDISAKYAHRGRMTNHVHYEVKTRTGEFLNPDEVCDV